MPFVNEGPYANFTSAGSGQSGQNIFIVDMIKEDSSNRLDKTWQEIYDAADAGALVLIRKKHNGEIFFNYWVSNIVGEDSWYAVYAYSFVNSSTIQFETTTANGYPSH